MKQMNSKRSHLWVILSFCLVLAAVGCDRDLAGELAAISGSYLGDVVARMATCYLQDAFGVEAPDGEHEADQSHAAGPLHDYEH